MLSLGQLEKGTSIAAYHRLWPLAATYGQKIGFDCRCLAESPPHPSYFNAHLRPDSTFFALDPLDNYTHLLKSHWIAFLRDILLQSTPPHVK